MSDDAVVTKVTVTRDHVAIEHPGGDPVVLVALALDTLRQARNIVPDPVGIMGFRAAPPEVTLSANDR